MTQCKEFNDCLKFKNWDESCGRSHDKFNSIDKVSSRYYAIYRYPRSNMSYPTFGKFFRKR